MKINKFILKQISDIKIYGIREAFRKLYLLIKIMASIPINIIAIVPCLIIRLIRPWIIIRIGRVDSTNYGELVREPTIYYCKKKLKMDLPKKKYLDLIYIRYNDKISNKQLVKMWKRKLTFLPSYLLDPINKVNRFIPGWKTHSIETLSDAILVRKAIVGLSKLFDVDNLIEKFQPLNFTPDEETHGKEMLKKFGLNDDDKFVCLAVRDGAYQLKRIPSRFRDWSYHSFRNHDIDNFVLAAESLAERGYYVFRMGVVVNKSFNLNNPKIIDYANSNLRNGFMDVYLGAKCSFCLSTGFGFFDLPYVFGKPIALLSLPFGELCTWSEKFFLLTKHHILKKEKRRLSLSEIFSHGAAYLDDTKSYEQKGVELVDNTPEEIRDLAIETAENTEFKKQLNPEQEELQKTFKNLFVQNLVKPFEYSGKKYNTSPFHGHIRSRFSTKFLEENKDWLK